MKYKFAILMLAALVLGQGCSKEIFEQSVNTNVFPVQVNEQHPWGPSLQQIIDEYTAKGVPGISVAISDNNGQWEGVSGYSKIETSARLQRGYAHAGGSIAKTYTAVNILKLYEQNKIKLDDKITDYLSENILHDLNHPELITVRMLLNHTSGIPDYIEDTNFKLHWFNDLSQRWSLKDILDYSKKGAYGEPGKRYAYSNTNYVLLSLIIEKVSGQQESTWIKENLFTPSDLNFSFYRKGSNFLDELPLPNYYLDRFGDGRLQNVTVPTKVEIYSEYGDGGIVASSLDFVKFMRALAHGQLVSNSTLTLMKSPPANSEYGFGLDIFNYKNKLQYGHQGAVFGGSALLLHFEQQDTELFIAANCDATLVGGKTLQLYHEMKNKICDLIASK